MHKCTTKAQAPKTTPKLDAHRPPRRPQDTSPNPHPRGGGRRNHKCTTKAQEPKTAPRLAGHRPPRQQFHLLATAIHTCSVAGCHDDKPPLSAPGSLGTPPCTQRCVHVLACLMCTRACMSGLVAATYADWCIDVAVCRFEGNAEIAVSHCSPFPPPTRAQQQQQQRHQHQHKHLQPQQR